ncbi:MAG: cell division protein ZapA [Lachnospiraceae bacterium]|nr:cell division protein ZapA [Lachnospiraceae bacterium]
MIERKKGRTTGMSSKNRTEVLIDGKIYTLSGYESEEYLQKVATYINNKLAEFKKLEGYCRQPREQKSMLLQLNIADDYFKAKKQVEMVEEELSEKDKELYDLKHELIAAQIKLETTERTVSEQQKELEEQQKKMIGLETELREKK